MYIITNIDGIKKEFFNDHDFLTYVKMIYKENEADQPYKSELHWSPENVEQAKEYLIEYCPDLDLEEN